MAKRFNRTLRELTYKYMKAHNTPKYLDTLPELLAHYNQHIHSSIDMAPADINRYYIEAVWQRFFKPTVPAEPYRFRPGDFIRTSQVAGQGQEAKGVQSQECQGHLVARHVHDDSLCAFLVRWCQLLSLG